MDQEGREKNKISVMIARFIMFLIKSFCVMTIVAAVFVLGSEVIENGFDLNQWKEEFQFNYQSIESLDFSLFEEKEEIFQENLQYWAYSTLSEDEQKVYLLIAETIINLEPNVSFKATDITEEDISSIWSCVLADFYSAEYVETISYKSSTFFSKIEYTVIFEYRYDTEEIVEQQAAVDQVVQEIISGIDSDLSEYEKVKAVYEYIVLHVDYEYTDYDQTIYGALVNQEAVCAGYARSLQCILNNMGISSTLVIGTTTIFGSDTAHGWNLVLVEDEYYYVDVTWADPNYSNEEDALLLADQVNYNYLLVTEDDISSNHYAYDYFELPEATATEYNFYVVEGLLVDTYSEAQLVEVFKNPVGDNYYTWKTEDSSTYIEIEWNITNNGLIWKILNQANIKGVTYYIKSYNDEMNCFNILLVYE